MSQPLTPFSIVAPGFYGLNTSDSPVDLSANFALSAINCVIDKAGRIGSRMGWVAQNSVNADLSTSDVTCIGECIDNEGTSTLLCTGGGFLFKVAGGVLTKLTYGGGGVAPTISADNWKFCQMNGVAMFWQRGYDPLIYDPAVSTTTFRRLNEKTGTAGTVRQANEAIAAYGRVWCADLTADKNTVYFSDLLSPHVWTAGSSGSLDLIGVWPKGGDEIVALAAHNNFLYIFGKFQVLIYSGASTPSTMTLYDTIVGVGCIARDSVANTGTDIIFLANDGIRSLMRTIQEKSAPLKLVSQNVNQDILAYVGAAEAGTIRAFYSPVNNFYLISFPTSAIAFCFDTRVPLDNGACRATMWTNLIPKALCSTKDGLVYFGFAGYVGKHSGYLDRTSVYRMSYYTTWIDFDPQVRTSILKKINLTLVGSGDQAVTCKWGYDYLTNYFYETIVLDATSTVAEYNIAEYNIAEYGADTSVRRIGVNGSSSGKVLQFGFEADINEAQVSIQRIDLYAKTGRLQ